MTATTTALLLLLTAAAGVAGRASGEGVLDPQEPVERTTPDIRVLEIRSDVRYRYARTEVFSKIANPANESQEVTFSAVLPEAAFISGLAITQDGVTTHARVESREQARETYNTAVSAGQTAAHAEESARDARLFTVALNVAARSKAAFNLTYEQLLPRERGRYRLRHMLDPGQVVQQMLVEVRIRDSQPLSLVRAASLRAMDNEVNPGEDGPDEPLATVQRPAVGEAVVTWQPDADAQRSLGDGSGTGLHGLLEIQYDVERTTGMSELVVGDGGYFVHFFAPAESELPPLPKHVVFVLDISGSMYGSKIAQLKEAMTAILGELRAGDAFSLVLFATVARVWSPSGGLREFSNVENIPADAVAPQNLFEQAQTTINNVVADGSTHMWIAFEAAFALVQAGRAVAPGRQPLIFFLTDGEPNGPRSTPQELEDAVKTATAFSAAQFYSVAFGRDAHFAFLRRLSLRGRGFARRVYEAADAALQLRNLYATVSSPLLANVTFQYADGQVENGTLTRSAFPVQLAGAELVVAGRLASQQQVDSATDTAQESQAAFQDQTLDARVIGDTADVHSKSCPAVTHRTPPQSGSFMERLWAYLTVRELLERAHGDDVEARARAEHLALTYSFVTPLTSLVAVAPAGDEARSALRDVVPSRNTPPAQPQMQGFQPPQRIYGLPGPSLPDRSHALSHLPMSPEYDDDGDDVMWRRMHDRRRMNGHRFNNPSRLDSRDSGDQQTTPRCSRQVVPLRRIHWIHDGILGNGTHVTLQQGTMQRTYLVGEPQGANATTSEACEVTERSAVHNGTCVPLPRCALRLYRDNVNKYLPYFCSIGEYAGTCCLIPEKKRSRCRHHRK